MASATSSGGPKSPSAGASAPGAVRKFFGRIDTVGAAIRCAVQLGGGPGHTLRMLACLWFTEGWKGYAWRIRLVLQRTRVEHEGDEIGLGPMDYRRWCQLHDTLDEAQRLALDSDLRQWPHRPLISVLMPVFNPSLVWLEQAVQSVREQVYPDWELCIADDASTLPGVRTLLQRLARQEPRIKLSLRTENGHICAASNTALKTAEGEFIALLDHDDLLPPHALYWVSRAILAHPEAGLIYSDEDKVDELGRRSAPHFKSAFNYDLFLSQNMVSHLGVYRRSLVDTVGGFHAGFEGSQDYDLALRCMEHLRPDQIIHIPRILYHWRVHANSTALNMAAKPYACAAAENALNAHLARLGQQGSIRYVGHGYEHCPREPAQTQRISAIICLQADGADLCDMAAKLRRATQAPIQDLMWVSCRCLPGPHEAELEAQAVRAGGQYIGAAHGATLTKRLDAALRHAAGDYVVFLQSGVQPRQPEWLSQLVAHAARPRVGVVGARLWNHDGTLLHAGVFLSSTGALLSSHYGQASQYQGYFGRSSLNQNFYAVSAACAVVKRALLEEVQGFDSEWTNMRYAMADLCLRLNARGHRSLWTPDVDLDIPSDSPHDEAWHAASEGQAPRLSEDIASWSARWQPLLAEDPHYNPNLSWAWPHFELAASPRFSHPVQAAPTTHDPLACTFRLAPYVHAPWERVSP